MKLPIVAHSSHVGPLDAERIQALGAAEMFLKPANPEDLIQTVRRLAGARE